MRRHSGDVEETSQETLAETSGGAAAPRIGARAPSRQTQRGGSWTRPRVECRCRAGAYCIGENGAGMQILFSPPLGGQMPSFAAWPRTAARSFRSL
jgi:hypothetical protein